MPHSLLFDTSSSVIEVAPAMPWPRYTAPSGPISSPLAFRLCSACEQHMSTESAPAPPALRLLFIDLTLRSEADSSAGRLGAAICTRSHPLGKSLTAFFACTASFIRISMLASLL